MINMEFGFFLKKFISFFVEPYGMVLLLFIIWSYFLFMKKDRLAKSFLLLALGTLFLFSYPPFANFLVKNLEDKYSKYEYKESVRYIHVLGSGHNDDILQPISSRVGVTGAVRVLEGVIIHKKMSGTKLIFTGYEGDSNITNAQMHANLALALGVKEENTIINGKPKDTREEASFTKSLLGKEKFVLVTSATHMPRAMRLFRSLGLNPIPAPTNFNRRKFQGYLKLPTPGAFSQSQIAMHEYLGILWSMIRS